MSTFATTFEELRFVGCHVRMDKIHVIRMRGFATHNLIMYCGTNIPGSVLEDEYFVNFRVGLRSQWPDVPVCKTCKRPTKGMTLVVLDDGTMKREAFV